MDFRRTSAVVLRYAYLLRGSPARIVPMFAWVTVEIVLWGFITRHLGAIAPGGGDWVPALLGAVLLWNFFVRVMHGVTMTFFEDVWSRNFLNLFASPLRVSEYLAGLVLSSVGTSAVGLAMMLFVAAGAFGLPFLSYGAAVIPFMLVLFLCGTALGVLACAVVLRLGPAAEWLVWPVPALLAPFAGVFYPLDVLPAWMRAVARAMPPAYVFEGLRAVVAGRNIPPGALLAGAALAALYTVLACAFFRATFCHAVRTGLIPRYSAETVA